MIALPPLVEAGYLRAEDIVPPAAGAPDRVDFSVVERFRHQCLRRAFEHAKHDKELARFREREAEWLTDYALFRSLKRECGEVEWTRWEAPLRDREPQALERARRELADEIAFRCFEQWLFDQQWRALREYAGERGVALIGDMPIFLAHDSADVWQRRELFQLDEIGAPRVVAGVPPDYFSATGQRWGNPLYDWPRIQADGFRFWIERIRSELSRFDILRIDHFIGFEHYWEIPASDFTAERGHWVPGPSDAIFDALHRALGPLPLIAEDLGEVTLAVKALRDRWALPGIRILQFAFGDDPSAPDFRPHNYVRNCVVYTGTHDNDTTVGWFYAEDQSTSTRDAEQVAREQAAALDYLGKTDARDIHWAMVRACMASVANTAIFPLQDLLGLGTQARMNRPGALGGNWEWRAGAGAFRPELAAELARLTRIYERHGTARAGT